MQYLQSALGWLYPLLTFMALFASARHIRLAKASPLLTVGFTLALASNIFSRILSTILLSGIHTNPRQPFPGSTSLYMTLSLISSLLSICGWALIAFGIYSVLEEVSRKLTLLQLAPQNAWNYQAGSNPLQGPMAQHQSAQNPFLPPHHYQSHYSQDQVREESHATPFMSPAPPAPSTQDDRPAMSVQPEQPVAPITLGSSRQ